MGSAPPPVGNQLPGPQGKALSPEAMHLQEVHRANMARRCFDKKLETKATDWRMHEDFITSIQPLGNARLQAERRRADAEREFHRMLEVREHGAEVPYRQSLQNYRSWQVKHPPHITPASGPLQKAPPPSHSTQPPKKKKPIPLVVHTPEVVSSHQPPQPSARDKLKASIGPFQPRDMLSAHAFEWQLQIVMPPEVFAQEPEKRTDWTTVRSDYSHGAQAGLRRLYAQRLQRTKDALPTLVEGEEQPAAQQATDKPAATDNEQTDQPPERPPDLVGNDIDSIRSGSEPETPVGEIPKDTDLPKVDDLGAIEGLSAEDSLILKHKCVIFR